ncbi:hypothetical protein RR46_01279 [Papilio xuthus]|uniref:Uncharacterized protein n=1 Tax=Papilio xuthus TaxID=66420 RepID=A0A0N1PGS3_PAPXU|nr:hypothetical protein RR46_01279 [Papilio xuthus]
MRGEQCARRVQQTVQLKHAGQHVTKGILSMIISRWGQPYLFGSGRSTDQRPQAVSRRRTCYRVLARRSRGGRHVSALEPHVAACATSSLTPH